MATDYKKEIELILKGRDEASRQVQGVTNSIKSFSESLHEGEGKLRGFNSMMELALGFHVGRFFFEKLHEGTVTRHRRLRGGAGAGEGFFDSVDDGVRKMLGLEARFEESAKLAKSLKETLEGLNKAMADAQSAELHARGGVERPEFPDLPNAKEVDQRMAELMAARRKAVEAAAPGWEEMGRAQTQLQMFYHDHPQGPQSGVDFGELKNIKTSIAEAKEKWRKQIDAEDAADRAIVDYRREIEHTAALVKSAGDFWTTAKRFIHAPDFLGGETTGGFIHTKEMQAEFFLSQIVAPVRQGINEALAEVGHQALAGLSEMVKQGIPLQPGSREAGQFQERYFTPDEILARELGELKRNAGLLTPDELQLARQRAAEKFDRSTDRDEKATERIQDIQSRFLPPAAGGGGADHLRKLEKANEHMKAIRTGIDKLNRKFEGAQSIGVLHRL